MTRKEIEQGSRRLEFLEKSQSLPQDTLDDLKAWWAEKVRENGGRKILPFEVKRP